MIEKQDGLVENHDAPVAPKHALVEKYGDSERAAKGPDTKPSIFSSLMKTQIQQLVNTIIWLKTLKERKFLLYQRKFQVKELKIPLIDRNFQFIKRNNLFKQWKIWLKQQKFQFKQQKFLLSDTQNDIIALKPLQSV